MPRAQEANDALLATLVAIADASPACEGAAVTAPVQCLLLTVTCLAAQC